MKKITKIWGIALIVVLLVSLLAMAAPASAADNEFVGEKTPGPPTYAVPAGPHASSDIQDFDIATDGSEIWMVTGTSAYAYKSTNGGATWSLGNTTAFAFYPNLIDIAPDNPSLIAVCDTVSMSILVSTNGGTTWSALPASIAGAGAANAAASITDMDVSATSAGKNYLAVSGVEATSGSGNVWYFDIGAAAPIWYETADLAGFGQLDNGGTGYSANVVAAISFSPNFPSDQVMVAVTANMTGATDNICLEIFSFAGSASARKWNDAALTFGDNYPVALITPAALGDGITAADISLDPEYMGSDDVLRNAFVGLSITGGTANSGVYRIKDTDAYAAKTNVAISAVAYDGITLAAGANDATTVYRSDDPMSSIPTFYPSSSLKSPSGTGNLTLAWNGTDLYAGTVGAESSFAVSNNNGKSFNDVSFIDTSFTMADDVAVATDGSKQYWVTDTGTYLSVWRKSGGWARVLGNVSDTGYIIRIAPDDPDVVYVADVGGGTVYYSKDGGEEKWYARNCTAPGGIIDLTVESSDVAYAVALGGTVVKTTNSGFTWSPPKATEATTGSSILGISENNLLIGDAAGRVYYSTDGNKTWTKITATVGASSDNVIMAADTDFANNNTIYATRKTTSMNVWKYVIGTSTEWEDIFSSTFASTATPYGMATINGALYVLTVDISDNQSSLWQCLSPTKATKTTPSWSSEPTTTTTDTWDTEVVLGKESYSPNALAASSTDTGNRLWMVKTGGLDNYTKELYSYVDALSAGGPTLVSPADGFSNPVNTVTGYANEIAFSWERLSNGDEWQLQISYDSAFKEKVATIPRSGPGADAPTVVLPVDRGRDAPADVNFQPGTTYYWRVKATSALYSPYSEVRTFTIQPGSASVPTVGSPANGGTVTSVPAFSWSPIGSANMYEFQLAADTTFGSPLTSVELAATGIKPDVTLETGMTYFWRVRAIAPVMGDWSTIANFSVAAPAEAAPPVVVEQVPAPVINIPPAPPAQEIVIPPAPAQPAPIAPAYIWAVIIIGAILVIAVIVLIVRTRRTV
ncbi:WD40/YVTN/BNR-like repeat-containing protein [Chloroflexota bacterium]